MSPPLFLIRLPLDPEMLYRQAHRRKLSVERMDVGYAVHTWLAGLFPDASPKPFHVQASKKGERSVWAYAPRDHHQLATHARAFCNDPEIFNACDWSRVQSKPMPETWRAGQRLGFEVRVCPVSRAGEDSRVVRTHTGERDVYLAALERAEARQEPKPDRRDVYAQWFARMCEGHGAQVAKASVEGFALAHVVRRRHSGGRRDGHVFQRPDASMTGTLEVTDPVAFGAFLARGVGRHRTFGFGMLRLLPPRD